MCTVKAAYMFQLLCLQKQWASSSTNSRDRLATAGYDVPARSLQAASAFSSTKHLDRMAGQCSTQSVAVIYSAAGHEDLRADSTHCRSLCALWGSLRHASATDAIATEAKCRGRRLGNTTSHIMQASKANKLAGRVHISTSSIRLHNMTLQIKLKWHGGKRRHCWKAVKAQQLSYRLEFRQAGGRTAPL